MGEPRERPIIFSSPMVTAIIDRRKRVTRRTVTMFRGIGPVTQFHRTNTPGYDWIFRDRRMLWNDFTHERLLARCPYGVVGDRLWVRETWQAVHFAVDEYGNVDDWYHAEQIPKSSQDGWWTAVYAAGDPYQSDQSSERRGFPWRPAIHMPRWAARLVLEVTKVDLCHLQSITSQDIAAEGFPVDYSVSDRPDVLEFEQRQAFAAAWDRMHGKKSPWLANHPVWVIEFIETPETRRRRHGSL